jgi:hypothetical protein
MGKSKRKTSKLQNRRKANHNLKTRSKTRSKTRTKTKSRMKAKSRTRRKTKNKTKKKTRTRPKKMKVMMGGVAVPFSVMIPDEELKTRLNKSGDWVVMKQKEGLYELAVAVAVKKKDIEVHKYTIRKIQFSPLNVTFQINKKHPDSGEAYTSKNNYASGDIQKYMSNLQSRVEKYIGKPLVLELYVIVEPPPAVPPRRTVTPVAPSRPPRGEYEGPPAIPKCRYTRGTGTMICPRIADEGKNYCNLHACPVSSCKGVKSSSQTQCNSHTCGSTGCNNIVEWDSTHCLIHEEEATHRRPGFQGPRRDPLTGTIREATENLYE